MPMSTEGVAQRLHTFFTEIGIDKQARGRDVMTKLGWTHSQQAKVLAGIQYPTIEMLQDLRLNHKCNINWLLTGFGAMYSDMGKNVNTEVQEEVQAVIDELKLPVNPRRFEHITRIIQRDFEREKRINKELIRDLVSM